jgi:UDP-3-O-[3-hydroxymyristoyl] glucosamine N-acyltransferase
MKLAELARILEAECRGDGELEITGVAGIEEAGPQQVTFVANLKYAPHARSTSAAAVIVPTDFPEVQIATLRIGNPYLAFAKAIEVFHCLPVYAPGIHPTAVIDPTASIGQNAHVGAYVVIGEGVKIGDNATLLPHVVIYPNTSIGNNFLAHAHVVVRESCVLGDNIILQNGVVIGADGFGFAKDDQGHWHKILQVGIVRMGDDIEVQAQSCVDRAAVGETRVARGVKIDNVTTVGHGSTIDEDSLICAQVGLAGSTHIGKNVVLAGQVGIAGHCMVGDGVIVTAQSGTHGDIEPGKVISGSPGFDHAQWLRAVNAFSRLPEMARDLKRLQRKFSQNE